MALDGLERCEVEANIVRFQQLLKSADESQRKLLKRLLLREHEKLAEFLNRS